MTCGVAYDVLGNERHKAVCELGKLSGSPSDIWVWKRQLGEAIGADNEMYSSINERLIRLLGGGIEPVAPRELFGILKEGDSGVDAGGRVETGGGRSDAAADGHMADSAGSQVSEGVAPITTELRETIRSLAIDDSVLTIGGDDFHRICDAIDAVHAQLERDYKVACEVNERQDEQYADMVHKLDRAYEKNRNQRKQLTEVQEALHRRNEGELKRRWMREKQDLELQIAKMRLESVELPKDADGVPIHAGDVLDGYGKTIEAVELRYGRSGWVLISRDGSGYADTFAFTHHHAPTVEDVLREFICDHEEDVRDEVDLIAEYAAKLRLAGDDAE